MVDFFTSLSFIFLPGKACLEGIPTYPEETGYTGRSYWDYTKNRRYNNRKSIPAPQ